MPKGYPQGYGTKGKRSGLGGTVVAQHDPVHSETPKEREKRQLFRQSLEPKRDLDRTPTPAEEREQFNKRCGKPIWEMSREERRLNTIRNPRTKSPRERRR